MQSDVFEFVWGKRFVEIVMTVFYAQKFLATAWGLQQLDQLVEASTF
jgi:hypothetical protein